MYVCVCVYEREWKEGENIETYTELSFKEEGGLGCQRKMIFIALYLTQALCDLELLLFRAVAQHNVVHILTLTAMLGSLNKTIKNSK